MSDRYSADRCCPYSALIILPVVLTIVAATFTWISAFGCSFFIIDNDNDTFFQSRGIGLWTIETQGINEEYCVSWDNSTIDLTLDTPLKFARGMGLTACIVSFLTIVAIIFPTCMTLPRNAFKVLGGTMFFLAVLCLLSLVALASDICSDAQSCYIGGAGIVGVVAAVVWIATALTLFCLQERPEVVFASPPPVGVAVTTIQEIPVTTRTETKTVNPDGTTTTTNVVSVTNPDGSRTVTETTVSNSDP